MTVGAAAGSLTFKYCIRQKLKNLVLSSIYDSDMDPHWMQCGSDPGSASILNGVDDVAKEVWFRQVPEDRTGPTEQEPQKGNTTVSG